MTKKLYLDDSYLKGSEATIQEIRDNYIILDQTIFYPESGGQLSDKGKIINLETNEEFNITHVKKTLEDDHEIILHEIEQNNLKQNQKVKLVLDWNRRYNMMKSHTSAHIVSAVIHKLAAAKITGNQLSEEKIRIDFNLEDFDKEKLKNYIEEANYILKKNLEIKTYYISIEQAEQDPEIFKLAKDFPEHIKQIRIVEIGDYDKQADGGTHVKNTSEIKKLEFLKAENKGKSNRRLYYKIL